jgi:hypothetical protein
LDLVSELANVVRALDAAGVPYALCDGIAVTIHGHVRATKDIDLLILPEDRRRALASVATVGFEIAALPRIFGVGTPAEREVQRVTKLGDGETLTTDFLLVGPAYEAIWSDRESYEWEGTRLTVVSLAGLLAMNRIAGRPAGPRRHRAAHRRARWHVSPSTCPRPRSPTGSPSCAPS